MGASDRRADQAQIGLLVDMMSTVRAGTEHSVADLSLEQLDHRFDDEANSIGALLYHMAAVEFHLGVRVFHERELSDAENEAWKAACYLGDEAHRTIRGFQAEHYLQTLRAVRRTTVDLLQQRSDDWLQRQAFASYPATQTNFLQLFHAIEDEISHRGQIRWLLRRMPHLP